MREALDGDWCDLFESLAELEHVRWAHWQRYMHGKCEKTTEGALTIPAHLVERWERQIACPYGQMAEVEKDSDREQVQRYFPLIRRFLEDKLNRGGGD